MSCKQVLLSGKWPIELQLESNNHLSFLATRHMKSLKINPGEPYIVNIIRERKAQ
jgi:hypothetical protein